VLRACEAEEKKAKEEVARVSGIARKAQEQERHLSRELDQLKAQVLSLLALLVQKYKY
jgi:hypothetical protein